MPANKIGSYIAHYRSRKREEAEQERQRRIEDAKRAPKIIDPSFELFGFTSPPNGMDDDSFQHQFPAPPSTIANDDWVFQNRRASTMPQPYQFEPYCEVTPKSSVSSSNSASSDAKAMPDYDTSWDTSNTARPRPQSYLPSFASANYSASTSDLHRESAYRSRRQTNYYENNSGYGYKEQQQYQSPLPPPQPQQQQSQSSYKVAASLTRPFSINDPLESFSEPTDDSYIGNQAPYTRGGRDY